MCFLRLLVASASFSLQLAQITFFLPNSNYKMMLYSVHDTTVAPLLLALGVFDNKWPDFAADLAFELYRDEV